MDDHRWPEHLYELGLLTGRDLDTVQLELLESGIAPEAHMDVLGALARSEGRNWKIRWTGDGAPSVYLATEDLVVYGTWRDGFAVMTPGGERGALPPPDRALLIVADTAQRRDFEASGLLPDNVKFTAGLSPDDVLSVLAGQPVVVFHPSLWDLTGVLGALLEHATADASHDGLHPTGVILSDGLLSNLKASQLLDPSTGGHALELRSRKGALPYVPPFASAPESELLTLLDLVSRMLGRGGRLDAPRKSWRQLRDEESDVARRLAARAAQDDEDALADARRRGVLNRQAGARDLNRGS